MKRITTLFAIAFLLGVPARSAAQGNSGPKIGVMNVLRAIIECQEGKLANEDFQTKYEARRQELAKKQKELEDLQQQLRSQPNTLNDQARAALGKNIEVKTTELQRAQEDAEKEFTGLRNEIFNRIGSKLAPVVQQYAKEYQFTLVFDSSNQTSQLSFVDPAIDITDDIIKRYDAAQVSSSGAPAAKKPALPPPQATPEAAAKQPAVPAKKN
jgi:Skp family chaperone for outer membrane proteins